MIIEKQKLFVYINLSPKTFVFGEFGNTKYFQFSKESIKKIE